MTSARTILVMESDAAERNRLAEVFHAGGYAVWVAASADEASRTCRAVHPAVLLIGSQHGGFDNLDLVARLRAETDAYIIMIGALADEVDVVSGLNAGADSYIAGARDAHTLRAQVNAVTRRPGLVRTPRPEFTPVSSMPAPAPDAIAAAAVATPPVVQEPEAAPPEPLTPQPEPAPAPLPAPDDEPTYGDTEAVPPTPPPSSEPAEQPAPAPVEPSAPDPIAPPALAEIRWRGLEISSGHTAIQVGDQTVQLTAEEHLVLTALITGARKTHSRASLARLISGHDELPSDAQRRAADQTVDSLRAKLGESNANPRWIEQVPGIGYRRTGR